MNSTAKQLHILTSICCCSTAIRCSANWRVAPSWLWPLSH